MASDIVDDSSELALLRREVRRLRAEICRLRGIAPENDRVEWTDIERELARKVAK